MHCNELALTAHELIHVLAHEYSHVFAHEFRHVLAHKLVMYLPISFGIYALGYLARLGPESFYLSCTTSCFYFCRKLLAVAKGAWVVMC